MEDGCDYVYVHVEAPDEMGHQGSIERKIQAIANIDRQVVDVIKKEMDASGEEYRLLVMPDHPTPIRCRTHTSDPVPYILYDSTKQQKKVAQYSEKAAAETGIFEPEGYTLIDKFIC